MWKVNCNNVHFDFDEATPKVPLHQALLPCSLSSKCSGAPAEYALVVSNAANPGIQELDGVEYCLSPL